MSGGFERVFGASSTRASLWRLLEKTGEKEATGCANPLAVTCRLQSRKFTPVSARSNPCTPVHEPSRPHFVHSREPA
jgi:hypothetical protein